MGTIDGDLTLRKAIDAIRGGFRSMYGKAKVQALPELDNAQVDGPYGRAFHDIGDLYIESIVLCGGDTLQISIGS